MGALWPGGAPHVDFTRGGFSYTYDANGNAVTRNDSSGITTFAWDYENRLTSVTLPGSGGTVSFKYDPLGRRIQKVSSAGTTIFAYDGDVLAEEVNGTGSVIARYAQGQGFDEPLAESTAAGATDYYEADGLGSITSLSNAAGSLAQTYTFDAFGKQTAASGSLTNPLRYTAREFDSDTNLYYYRARYYDPSTGRFLSEDPISFDAGTNFYAYVHNAPTGLNDPFGLAECVYSVSQHTLVCIQNPPPPGFVGPTQRIQVGPGGLHSGDPGKCGDNPQCVNNWGSGPITPGRYRMNFDDRPEHQGWGDYRLEPWPHQWWYGLAERLHLRRGGFELHIGSITHGCINAEKTDPLAVDQFHRMQQLLQQEDGSNYLQVIP